MGSVALSMYWAMHNFLLAGDNKSLVFCCLVNIDFCLNEILTKLDQSTNVMHNLTSPIFCNMIGHKKNVCIDTIIVGNSLKKLFRGGKYVAYQLRHLLK